jgi:hypothetical protein
LNDPVHPNEEAFYNQAFSKIDGTGYVAHYQYIANSKRQYFVIKH